MPWNRICCAIDFGEPSRIAVAAAADLARRTGAALTLLHVHVPPPPAASEIFAPPPDLGEESATETRWLLDASRAEAEAVALRAVEAVIGSGEPATEIVRFARERGADLLVLGTHGRRGVKRLLLGSVAERVVREAPCPVLVARAAAEQRRKEADDAAESPARVAERRPL